MLAPFHMPANRAVLTLSQFAFALGHENLAVLDDEHARPDADIFLEDTDIGSWSALLL